MIDKLLLIIFEVCFGIKINLIGVISPSEFFLIISSIYYLKRVKPFKNRDLALLTRLYIGLIIVQIITETIINNSFNNAAKGIAVNIVSYLHVIFLYYYFCKNRKLLIYAAIGYIIKIFLFNTIDETSVDPSETAFIGYLKFYLVPIITYSLIIISCIYRKSNLSFLICFVGLVLIVLGARSGGGILFVSGFINYLISIKNRLNTKNLKVFGLVSCLILYGGYCFYVQKVLDGEINSGNSEQLLKAKNPYNPINLLMVGRQEVFVGYIAFTDKPLTGWGAWAKDPNMKYHMISSIISNSVYNEANILYDEIPSHSVIIGSAMMNGVFALLFMLSIFIYTIKKTIYIFGKQDIYMPAITILFIDFIWHMCFSPQSAFRYIIPIDIAFILCSYHIILLKRKKV